ncbi:hypothetical protein GF356_03975, partial [candidate division GN15 bacterium]|nr:hypothetical protein [candidate division GN15 bacterium]
MFFLSVGKEAAAPGSTTGEVVTCRLGNLTVFLAVDSRLGTHRVFDDKLIVCESVTRLTDDVFSRLVDRSETLDELHDSLPDGIQTLA